MNWNCHILKPLDRDSVDHEGKYFMWLTEGWLFIGDADHLFTWVVNSMGGIKQ